jgi:hypothetical protein
VINVLAVDRPRWVSGDASFLVDVLLGIDPDPPRARKVRGTIDLRFSDVEEENAFDNPDVRRFLRDLYDRAPWAAYYVVPSRDQVLMLLVAHGASLEPTPQGPAVMVTAEVVTALENVVLLAAGYAVEHGDDWRAIVEPWAGDVAPDLVYLAKDVLGELYDRHAGLHLTASGWVGPDAD